MAGAQDAFSTVAMGEHGVTLVRAGLLDLPGVVHGFATRAGGVSLGTRAGLNFGIKGGDPLEHVQENHRRLAAALGVAPARLFRQNQVHGTAVQVVGAGDDFQTIWDGESDAMVTADRGVALGVVTGDCVPVLLAAPEPGVAAAVHAGWRGMADGVIQAAVAVMEGRFGCARSELRAATGPCAGPCCYEVGEEVASHFEGVPGAVQRAAGRARPHLDLTAAASHILDGLGIAAAHARMCTICHAERFYSYRRDAAGTGLQMSVIGLKG